MAIFTYTAKYLQVNSETCASKGYHLVSSKHECETAARDLGLNETSAIETAADYLPTGCVGDRNMTQLVFNTDVNDLACGIKPERSTKPVDCICTNGKFKHFYSQRYP